MNNASATEKLGRPGLIHGVSALFALSMLLALLSVSGHALISPKLAKLAELRSKAETVDTLRIGLFSKHATLADKAQLIGVKPESLSAFTTGEWAAAQLQTEADTLRSNLEALGFQETSRTLVAERPINDELSAFSARLIFEGNSEAAILLLLHAPTVDAYIASFVLNGEDVPGGETNITLSIDLQRIGVRTNLNEGVQSGQNATL